jgi:hypothetical protein
MVNLKPIQIGRDVVNWQQLTASLAQVTKTPVEDPRDLHVTLMWSRTPVDWDLPVFQPRQESLVLPRDGYWLSWFEGLNLCVLEFENEKLSKRRAEIEAGGAQSDFVGFRPHLSIGRTGRIGPYRGVDVKFPHHIILGPEFVKPAKI